MDEGISEVGDGTARYSDPVNVKGVSWAGHRGIKWVVDIVKEAITKTDIQTRVWPGSMDQHAGGAHVSAAVATGREIQALCVPYLPS